MSEKEYEVFVSAEENAEQAQQRRLAGVRSQGREAAILTARLLGAHEAERRGETGVAREQRIARAMGYAAWEYDGKPLGAGRRYAEEFGIPEPGSLPAQVTNGTAAVASRCSRASRHHLHHGSKPCPECGYPKAAA